MKPSCLQEKFYKSKFQFWPSGIYPSPLISGTGSPLTPISQSWDFRPISGVGEAACPGHSEALRLEKMRPRCCEGEQSPGGQEEVHSLPSPPPLTPFFLDASVGPSSCHGFNASAHPAAAGAHQSLSALPCKVCHFGKKKGRLVVGSYSKPSPGR